LEYSHFSFNAAQNNVSRLTLTNSVNIAWTRYLGFCFHWQIEEVFKARLLGGLMNSSGGKNALFYATLLYITLLRYVTLKLNKELIIPISQLIALNFIIHTLKQYKML